PDPRLRARGARALHPGADPELSRARARGAAGLPARHQGQVMSPLPGPPPPPAAAPTRPAPARAPRAVRPAPHAAHAPPPRCAPRVSATDRGGSNLATSATMTPGSATINAAPTSITLHPVPGKTTYGTAVTLTASVNSPDTSVPLAGQVQFYDNGVALGAAVAV